jgi:hypothetical protein
MEVTNTLAYYDTATFVTVKEIIIQAPGDNLKVVWDKFTTLS